MLFLSYNSPLILCADWRNRTARSRYRHSAEGLSRPSETCYSPRLLPIARQMTDPTMQQTTIEIIDHVNMILRSFGGDFFMLCAPTRRIKQKTIFFPLPQGKNIVPHIYATISTPRVLVFTSSFFLFAGRLFSCLWEKNFKMLIYQLFIGIIVDISTFVNISTSFCYNFFCRRLKFWVFV